MSIAEEYRKIYDKEVCQIFNNNVKLYDKQNGVNIYQPLSHNCEVICKNICNHDCYKNLGNMMRKNIIFYCYGEDEIVERYKNRLFQDLEKATKYAYNNRLPKRHSEQDGLPGEVLLDTIIQSMLPNAYKLAVRTIFRQNDNVEIKGYDLTYFTNENGKITLWLGQAKLGNKQYCRTGILDDLSHKYTELYMADQLFFLADKPVGLTEQGKQIAGLLNELNILNVDESKKNRSAEMIKLLKDKNIDICIPCLLAYEKKEVYEDKFFLINKLQSEIEWAKSNFEKNFPLFDLKINIIFIIFPLDDVNSLRGDEGFYDGLH